MAQFTGQLNANEIQSVLFNMIISQEVFADDIAGDEGSLVGEARVDGSLFGDTKLYISTDINKTHQWNGDSEAANLLDVDRPVAPKCQKIVLDNFRQIRVTTDQYLSKRAFATEGVFGQYNARVLGWMRDTKAVFDETLYNVFIGTTSSTVSGTKQNVSIDVTTAVGSATGEEANRLEAQAIAKGIASLVRDMTTKPSRAYNDYKFMRKYSKGMLKFVWNGEYVDKITKLDLPTIFHKDGLVDFEREIAQDYFGTVNTVAKTAADADTRSLIEQDIAGTHYFPGEVIPSGTSLVSGGAITVPSYQVDKTVICKVFVKLPPYMSAFETETSFVNGRALLTNHYLTWGFNTLAYLEGYPMVTVKKA